MNALAARLLPLAFAAIDDADAALVLYDAIEESWEELTKRWPRLFVESARSGRCVIARDRSRTVLTVRVGLLCHPSHAARAIAAALLFADWSTEMWPVAARASGFFEGHVYAMGTSQHADDAADAMATRKQ